MAKIIKVCGNQGKSIFSFYLAKELAKKNKVIVISVDPTYAVAQTLFFKKDDTKSIGKLLSKPYITQQEIFSQINFFGNDLGYLGYARNETEASYPEVLTENISKLINEVLNTTDYLIIDGRHFGSKIEDVVDTLDPCIISITSADSKGLAYRNAFDKSIKNQIDVLLENNPYSLASQYLATYVHPPKYTLKYCKELGSVYNVTGINDIPIPKSYHRVLIKLIKERLC